MHDQDFLNFYFKNYWIEDKSREHSSYEKIAKKIESNEWLLDVGCGRNHFKKLHSKVIGIDPAFDEADINTTIENYIPDRLFDVCTCLGSINFGSKEIIDRQISKIVSCLKKKSRIFWRLNPGRNDHNNKLVNKIIFYPWTFEELKKYAELYNYNQVNEIYEEHLERPRLYCEWYRIA